MKQESKYATREQWLLAAAEALKPLFLGCNFKIPTVRVATGFPSKGALSPTRRRIGECWAKEASADGLCQIWISPLLIDPVGKDKMGVLPTLAHELLHAVLGDDAGHGPQFVKACRKLGLDGKATATHAGEMLAERLEQMAVDLGPFPHEKLNWMGKIPKKQTTRMIKCECAECGYVARTSTKWIEDAGTPICPKDKVPMLANVDPGSDPEDETDND